MRISLDNADTDNDDDDDNGTLNVNANFPGAVVSATITLGAGASEPIGESDLDSGNFGNQPDDQSNMTVDFGFYKTQIGNLVYFDDNANGTYDASEILANGVTLELFAANDTTLSITTTTTPFGFYRFDGLPEGDYIVKVTSPAGTVSTIDTNPQNDNDDPNLNVNNNDNGDGTSAGIVASAILTMDAGYSGSQTNNVVDDSDGSTFDHTLDFGFVYSYALGNRVWFDTDNSSDINGSEVGVNDVTVELYAADDLGNPIGAILATDITTSDSADDGYYLFDYLFPGDYVVVIPSGNFADGAVLNGYHSSATEMLNTGITNETRVTGASDDDADVDDNGLLTGGDVISVAITLGPVGGTEPSSEADVDDTEAGADHQGDQDDDRANMTVDFGFYKTEIGNLVFGDVDKDGAFTTGDIPYSNITMRLYSSDGTEILVGPDGVYGTADDATGSVLTDVQTNGSGIYLFSGLPAGDYIVKATVPNGTVSTIDSNPQADNDDPNGNIDSNDNGVGMTEGDANGLISSDIANPLTMNPGDARVDSQNIVDDGSGTQGIDYGTTFNPTMDFGFTTVYSLGNRVWFDTNNNATIDNSEGVDGGGAKVGVDGVSVELYAADGITEILVGADGILGTADDGLGGMVTKNGGYYLFDHLESGDYVVIIPAANFGSGQPLEGYYSSLTIRNADGTLSETTALDPDANTPNTDSNDDGTQNGSNDIVAIAVTLGAASSEPVNEADVDVLQSGTDNQGDQPDNQANMTVDFGFYKITQGDLVWLDTDNNGLFDGVEVGRDGVLVELWSEDGNTMLDSTITSGGGLYSFDDLVQGNYLLIIPESQFVGAGSLRDYYSSTGNGVPAPSAEINTTDSDDNGDEIGSLGFTGGYVRSSVFTLTPAVEAFSDNDTGITSEPRIDFGFHNNPIADLEITKTDNKGGCKISCVNGLS